MGCPGILRKREMSEANPQSVEAPFCLPRLWKWQYPAQMRRLLEELQRLKPQMVIGDHWYSFAEDDRYWWKN